mmetsp:Transcript_131507/g.195938  ORF Transcript_131507/g.195938 Transcript_131507/m.195938 type:complete len:252 (+) Transcript_131507:355-1110(+)
MVAWTRMWLICSSKHRRRRRRPQHLSPKLRHRRRLVPTRTNPPSLKRGKVRSPPLRNNHNLALLRKCKFSMDHLQAHTSLARTWQCIPVDLDSPPNSLEPHNKCRRAQLLTDMDIPCNLARCHRTCTCVGLALRLTTQALTVRCLILLVLTVVMEWSMTMIPDSVGEDEEVAGVEVVAADEGEAALEEGKDINRTEEQLVVVKHRSKMFRVTQLVHLKEPEQKMEKVARAAKETSCCRLFQLLDSRELSAG